MKFEIIPTKAVLYDKCKNTEQLYDNFYFPLLVEFKELKKQLEEANEKILLLQVSEPMLEYKKALEENQQKEFIEWLENGINQVRNTEFLDEIIQRAGLVAYNRVLSKYKKIIGVPIAGLDDEEEPDLFEMIEDMENKPKHIEEIKLVEIQNLWDRDIEIEKKLKEITKAVNYLLDKDKK